MTIPSIFDISNSEKYIMSIRLKPDGLSFSGYDPLRRGSFFYKEFNFQKSLQLYSENVKEFFFRNELLVVPYKKVNIIHVSSQYTLVPEEVSPEGNPSLFLNFNFSSPVQKALATSVAGKNVSIVFGIDEEVHEFCLRTFVNPSFAHYLSPLLTYWSKPNLSGLKKQMYVNVHEKMLDIICVEQESLLFVNTFAFEHLNDILYYILYVWKQLEMDQLSDNLFLCGISDMQNHLLGILRKYVQNSSLLEIPSEVFLWGEDIGHAPIDLITLLLCV